MLDWVNSKNICIPGYTKNVFDDFNKLYYNHGYNRLEIITGACSILVGPTFTFVGGSNLVNQLESNVLMTWAAEGLLSNEAQIPSEAGLVGHLETAKVVGGGTLNDLATALNHADPDTLMTEA